MDLKKAQKAKVKMKKKREENHVVACCAANITLPCDMRERERKRKLMRENLWCDAFLKYRLLFSSI